MTNRFFKIVAFFSLLLVIALLIINTFFFDEKQKSLALTKKVEKYELITHNEKKFNKDLFIFC